MGGRHQGQVTSGGFLDGRDQALGADPGATRTGVAVWGYLLLIACIVVLVQLKGWWRIVVLVPTLYLTAFVWENLLHRAARAVTRSVLFGVLLIAVMTIRARRALRAGEGGDRLMVRPARAQRRLARRSAACR